MTAWLQLLVDVVVHTEVVLHVALAEELVAGKLVKGLKDVQHAQQCTEDLDKRFLLLLTGNDFAGDELPQQLNQLFVALDTASLVAFSRLRKQTMLPKVLIALRMRLVRL